MNFKQCLMGIAAGVLGILAPPASADLVFHFTSNGGGFPPSDYGTVTLHQVAVNQVQVSVNLASGVGFVNTGLEPFTFNLAPSIPTPTGANFSAMTAGFSFDPTSPVSQDGAGTFQYGLLCTAAVCGNGGNQPFVGPLNFLLTAAGLLETSFVGNGAGGSGNFFGADVCRLIAANGACTGGANTGAIWTGGGGPPNQTPEPQTLALLVLGLFGVTLARRRCAVLRK